MSLSIDFSKSMVLKKMEISKDKSRKALNTLLEGTGEGNDFLGWINWPKEYDKDEFDRIKKAAKEIKDHSDVLVVIGIGGSYLGAKAVQYALSPYFTTNDVEIIYAGHQMSSSYLKELMDYLEDKDFSVNIISKSGTTTEPAIAFRFLKQMLEDRYGKEESKKRIYATTDRGKGALKGLADEMNYESFVIPDNIGGRFSVLTAVGLLPLAAAGVDIDALMEGAALGVKKYKNLDFDDNIAMQYALYRNILYKEGKTIEILANYEPKLKYFSEWWKQLFGESEGKDGEGLFPVSVNFTTDLHSMGQMIQEGKRNILETVLRIKNPKHDLIIEEDPKNLDGLNYIAGKSLDYVNKMAAKGVAQAHFDGDVPVVEITMDELDERHIGELMYFFEISVGISGYILEVNPFNQPGVEKYKSNMFRLLGKPGYEQK
ncbi:MAG: glucose-6-phosphate isomerase [Tissierellia bacterium]|nr:glucose-6-phosphate isomerase [Tissierellia bacterium]